MRSVKLALFVSFAQTICIIGYVRNHVLSHHRLLSASTHTNRQHSSKLFLDSAPSSPQEGGNDDEFFETTSSIGAGPEQSQIYDFISDFLKKDKSNQPDGPSSLSGDDEAESSSRTTGDDTNTRTHLIAIPVDGNNELLLELESVQRAILYHCPVLVHACITQSMTRLPLLYVHATSSNVGGAGSGRVVTSRLNDIVCAVVKESIFVAEADDEANIDSEGESSINEVQREDGTIDITGANTDGIKPLMIPFQSLEVDGAENEVLLTVASESSPGTKKLVKLVQALRERIQKETGWTTSLPPDLHSSDSFRPRIPFMRLPDNWEDFLEKDPDNPDQYLTSDQGGNGISPILWGQWMDDEFGGEARMKEVAVYPRPFYLPSHSVQLPKGNMALAKIEAEFQEYQEQRMAEAEELLEEERGGKDVAADIPENDPLLVKTMERLGDQLSEVQSRPLVEPEDTVVTSHRDPSEEISIMGDFNDEGSELRITSDGDARPEDPSALDEWTRNRVRQAVDSRARVQSEIQMSTSKQKPPIESNPIFNKYKDGTLVPEKDEPQPTRELPPFPARDHCFGFWRVLRTPTGFEVEEGDSTRSDNLILRVDGTTAGGPILDQETRQKASAGTWRITGDTPETAKLRIRLIIPPKKERILVLKGKLELVSMSADLPLAKSTFGIPALEEKAAKAASDIEDLLYCSGTVAIEDAVTGLNRKEIGDFSIMKLNTPTDPSQYTITTPRPVRSQD